MRETRLCFAIYLARLKQHFQEAIVIQSLAVRDAIRVAIQPHCVLNDYALFANHTKKK